MVDWDEDMCPDIDLLLDDTPESETQNAILEVQTDPLLALTMVEAPPGQHFGPQTSV